jgi:hypothetical protein
MMTKPQITRSTLIHLFQKTCAERMLHLQRAPDDAVGERVQLNFICVHLRDLRFNSLLKG